MVSNFASVSINGFPISISKITVAAGATVYVALPYAIFDNVSFVSLWSFVCTSNSDPTNAALINASITINQTNFTTSFVMPAGVSNETFQFTSSTVNTNATTNEYIFDVFVPSLTSINNPNSFSPPVGPFLPYLNISTQLGGDLTGYLPDPTVAGLQDNPVEYGTLGVAQDGYVLTWNGSEWAPIAPGASAVVTMAGDVTGQSNANTVVKLQNHPVSATAPTTNQVLEYNGSAWAPTALPSSLPPSGSAGGDLGGTYPNPTVVSVGDVTTGVLPAANQAHQTMGGAVTGTTAASTIVLTSNAGITGVLPTANQADQSVTLIGDVTSSGGNTGSATTVVAAIQGVVVSGTASSGKVLEASSAIAASWQTPPTGFTAGGDLSGTATSQEVIGILNKSLPSLPVSDGYLNYTGSSWQFSGITIPSSLPPSGAAGGDLGGSYPNPTVLSVAHVTTGTLPAANQAAQTMGGAVTGTTAASTITNLPVADLAAGTSGQLLLTNGSTPTWTTVSQDGYIGATGLFTVTGAEAGAFTFGSPTGLITIAQDMNAPGIIQQTLSSVLVPSNFSITPQAPNGGSGTAAQNTPGSLIVNLTNPGVTGTAGVNPGFGINQSGTNICFIQNQVTQSNSPSIYLGSGTPSVSNYSINVGTTMGSFLTLKSTQGITLSGGGTITLSPDAAVQMTLNGVSGVTSISNGNISLNNASGNFGSGLGVTFVSNAGTNPTTSVTGGGLLYASGTNAFWWTGTTAYQLNSVNGATVPVAGSLTTGNVLQVSGASALTYAAVNLAGGSNYVTGTLPSGNQAAQTMGGAVGGTTAASTISLTGNASITGNLPVTNLATGSTGQVLLMNGSSPTWTTVSQDGYIGATGLLTVSQAEAGAFIFGSPSGLITVAQDMNNPGIIQAPLTSALVPNNFTITPQAPSGLSGTAAQNTPGSFAVNLAVPGSVGTAGAAASFNVNTGGNKWFYVQPYTAAQSLGAVYIGNANSTLAPSTLNYSIIGGPTLQVNGTTGVELQSNGNNVFIVGASGITFNQPAFTWASSVLSPIISQTSTSGGSGTNLTVSAQGTTQTSANGGNLYLSSGLASSGTDGYVALQIGGIDQFQVGTSTISIPNYLGSTAGVVHNSSAGVLSSSLIVNADVATAAGIAVTKLAGGTTTQILLMDATVPTWTTVSGDYTISATGVGVNTAINGTTVPAGGALTTGNQLIVSGSSAATWAALNLAGGAGYVTGTLPAGNQAAQTMGGAVGGTTASSTINLTSNASITGNLPVTNLAAGLAAQFLVNSATPTPAWVAMSGDVKLSSTGSTTVVGVDGYLISNTALSGQVLEFNGTNLVWTTISSGTITLTGDTTGSGTSSIVTTTGKINGSSVPAGGSLTTGNVLQVSGSSALTYAAVNLAGGAGYVTGVLPAGNMAAVNLAGGSSSVTGLLPVADLAVGTAAQILMNNATPTPTWTTISQDGYFSSSGLLTVTQAQSGDILFGSGSTRGLISVINTLTNAGLTQLALASTSSGSGSNGQNLSIVGQAGQAATGASHNGGTGGELILSSGAGGISGSAMNGAPGTVLLQNGGTTAISIVGGVATNPTISIPSFSTAGILHNAVTTGALSSSLIVNADISTSANIAVTCLAAGTSAQFLMSNATPTPTWTTCSGDMSLSATGVTTNLAIHGATVPAAGSLTTGNGLYVTGTSALSYSALNLAGGANYVTGLLPIANIAVGTAAQILMNNATPAATWTTVSQDGYFSSAGLLTVTDAQSGDIVFGSGATRGQISVASALTHAGLTQALISTNSATGSNMNISAQNATGTTSIGGNVIITPGTGTSTNGSTKIVALNSTTNANIVFAPAQGTPVSQAGQIVHYTGYCTVLDNTVTVLTIPLPTSNTSVSVSCQGIWRITTATGIGTGGTQMILTYAKNLSGTVTTGSGTVSSNIAGPDGDTTVLSEVTFGTAISGTNLLIQLISSTATTSFSCTVYATAIFS